jgi:hypothetical protein
MPTFSALGNTDALATSRRMSRPGIGLAMTPAVALAASRWRAAHLSPLGAAGRDHLPLPETASVVAVAQRFWFGTLWVVAGAGTGAAERVGEQGDG